MNANIYCFIDTKVMKGFEVGNPFSWIYNSFPRFTQLIPCKNCNPRVVLIEPTDFQ